MRVAIKRTPVKLGKYKKGFIDKVDWSKYPEFNKCMIRICCKGVGNIIAFLAAVAIWDVLFVKAIIPRTRRRVS